MNRAMFSGVAGLKAHQTRMDVIGNNIANVNTSGYKCQDAQFSDVMYQTLASASGGDSSKGGTNPSTVGYGSSIARIRTDQSTSSLISTSFGTDLAITGEGYFQVMDADGNTFYTKCGTLGYDANSGYLTDLNGYFVLGAGSADGGAGTQKIKLDNLPATPAKQPLAKVELNGVNFELNASNATADGNLSISFASSEDLPAGLKAQAVITSSGAIAVTLNANEKFANIAELNTAINDAITEANGGVQHKAGVFTLTADKEVFGTEAQNGSFTQTSLISKPTITLGGGAETAFSLSAQDIKAITNGMGACTVSTAAAASGTAGLSDITLSVSGKTYECKDVDLTKLAGKTLDFAEAAGGASGKISLKVEDSAAAQTFLNGATNKSFGTMAVPANGGIKVSGVGSGFTGAGTPEIAVTGTTPNNSVELKVGTVTYKADTTATTQMLPGNTYKLYPGGIVKDDTASPPVDNTNDYVEITIPDEATLQLNLGQANTVTGNGLLTAALIDGTMSYTLQAAKAAQSVALTGAQLVGQNFGVESGNVKLDETARLFEGKMTFMKAGTAFSGEGNMLFSAKQNGEEWTITAQAANGKTYSATIDPDTVATSILMQNVDGTKGDTLQMGIGSAKDFVTYLGSLTPDPATGDIMGVTNGACVATPSTKSLDVGLSSKAFTLSGGTEGGAVTLDQLSNIAIAPDGSVTVTHPDQGTVKVGSVSLATFANPAGLMQAGTNYFSESANSGEAVITNPGENGTGTLKSNTLEQSNVDLSTEMADMITTQRGFQANSRVITVSDTMLEELINLKR